MKLRTKRRILFAVMLFIQYMMLPVWFVPMLPFVQSMPGGKDWAFWCGLVMGFGTFTSPLIGMIADRFFNAERVLAICNFLGVGLLLYASGARSAAPLFVALLLTMLVYMPTWSLTASILMTHVKPAVYARLRVFGTLGWVASGLFSLVGTKCFGIVDFDQTPWIFVSGAAVSLAGGMLAFFLPETPPEGKGKPMSVVDALGLRALSLFGRREFLFFALILILAMVPFQWYNVYCAAFLKETGFRFLTVTLNLGQVGEIGFMLLVPWIISRFGFQRALVLALVTLLLRNLAFAGAAAFGVEIGSIAGILVHGLIFGILVVGSQMYVAEIAPEELRNQAQGLVMLLMAGVGVFLSNGVFDRILRPDAAGVRDWTSAYLVAAALSLLAMVLAAVLVRGKKKKPCL